MLSNLITIGFAAVLVAQSSTPQSAAPQKPVQERPIFRTEANFVRVDVYPVQDDKPVQDLRAEDFEVREDGVPQTIETFEHVVIRPAGPQTERAEPNTIEASRQLAANPRARVFVLFLDVPHVTVEGTWNIREPLIRLVDRILGPDDLIGIMTPDMAASDLVLARKTDVISGGLRDKWPWGERFTLQESQRETEYRVCYPPTDSEAKQGKDVSDLARELMARRRERAVLDSLTELVRYLRFVREERKAILTVTEGWLLFRPKESLTNLRVLAPGVTDPIPTVDPIGVGPGGKLTTHDRRSNPGDLSRMECDADRQHLALMDNWLYFRDLMDDANRSNASFYAIDPRGLPVFDAPIGPEAPPPPSVDFQNLRNRLDTLRILAANTDGIAITNSNDLDKGLRRISDDLTSYYLLGYYSKNTKLDGRFREIKVRVKRPGVDVRARRGYRAATVEEVSAARAASAAPIPESKSSVAAAVASLNRIRPGARLHVNAVAGVPAGTGTAKVWVAGEVTPGTGTWSGGTAQIDVSGPGITGAATVTIEPSARAFLAVVPLSAPVSSGALDVRVRLSGGGEGGDGASAGFTVPIGLRTAAPLLYRRGPSTGNRPQPAATFQFSRSDRVRIELPIRATDKPGAPRLLDRTGQPLGVPVTGAERTDDGTGQRWLTADLTLAPLAAGDYVVELVYAAADGEQRTLVPLRVVR
ncbi:MAG: hypothetical protein A3G21_16820 [Acidobacteria bacterium RIFCSPLOWO2_12_FULL_66_21]|nr:MAG: hypothetical protein A3G21_16820 [Acidobacteria bacterium RIFCSPLOWO2_12_FULL_66_21]